MKIHISMLDVSLSGCREEEKETYLEQMMEGLSLYRQEKVRRIRFLEDKLCSAGAGFLFKQGLSLYGISEEEAEVGFYGNGKPCLLRHPEIHFNLSHSGSVVLAVFSDREIGCDLEKDKQPDFRIANRFFHEREKQILETAISENDRQDYFWRFWTLKESFLKATGEGMRMDMRSFGLEFLRTPEAVFQKKAIRLSSPEQTAVILQEKPIGEYYFFEWGIPDYHAAFCAAGQPGDVFFSFQNLQDVV